MPRSLMFFVATAVVFVLQAIPIVGIFLMFALAMFWSVVLINAGMIGTAVEALAGRVSRVWLVLPLVFYGGYWAVAAQDHATLRALGASYDATNAKIAIPFDAGRHVLIFQGKSDGNGGSWFVQNYNLPVAYSRNANYPEGFRSSRMIANDICAKVRENPALNAAAVWTFGFHDGDAIGESRMERRFCDLGMPERPVLPAVTVARHEDRIVEGLLPVTRVTTTVAMPDGRRFTLLGGFAAPLSWIPMPVMGCGLNSGAPSWDCDAGFWRHGFTPIVTGNTLYSRDSFVLARALGLKRVAVADRHGGDATLVLAKIAEVEKATLARQLARIDAMIADPLAKVEDWDTGVVANRPEALTSRAEPIMRGLERAAPYATPERWKARESGRILAGLLAKLPRGRFVAFGPRILALYSRADDEHWLWESETLIRRLGDLGIDALPYLINHRASSPSVNGAGIEGLCRIGPPAKAVGGPVLLAMWAKTRDFDRNERRNLFVAMRRIGMDVPPLPVDPEAQRRRESANRAFGGVFAKQREPFAALREDWGDVFPDSPPRVCATDKEEQARREEKYSGKRRTNID